MAVNDVSNGGNVSGQSKPSYEGLLGPSMGRRRPPLTSDQMSHRQIIATIVGVTLIIVAMVVATAWGCDRSDSRSNRTKAECIAAGGSWAYGNQCLNPK